MTPSTAVVLFNLGGPDSPKAVRPFLLNLFSDPAILRQPAPLRWLLTRVIAARRTPVAKEIYGHIGGRSPILEQTRAQADELSALVAGENMRVFVCMRYWHPMAPEVVQDVKASALERIVMLPLYPQYSTATTGSAFRAWDRAAGDAGLVAKTKRICCFPTEPGFIESLARLTDRGIEQASQHGRPRVLFSAHGLPEKFIEAGDPYKDQVERTVGSVVARLDRALFDHVICYQSRVGPLVWIGPYTEDEISRAGGDHVPVVVVPIAFVSEHSETLVELDLEYARIAEESGVPAYVRVPVVGTDPLFIESLAGLVRRALDADGPIVSGAEKRTCPIDLVDCPLALVQSRVP